MTAKWFWTKIWIIRTFSRAVYFVFNRNMKPLAAWKYSKELSKKELDWCEYQESKKVKK